MVLYMLFKTKVYANYRNHYQHLNHGYAMLPSDFFFEKRPDPRRWVTVPKCRWVTVPRSAFMKLPSMSWSRKQSFLYEINILSESIKILQIYLIKFISKFLIISTGKKQIWVLIYLYYVTDILKHELYLMNFSQVHRIKWVHSQSES